MAGGASTLSGDAKDALTRDIPAAEHCRAALRAGLRLYGAPDGLPAFRTQRPAVARLFLSLAGPVSQPQVRRGVIDT